jgi:hypothetical protein
MKRAYSISLCAVLFLYQSSLDYNRNKLEALLSDAIENNFPVISQFETKIFFFLFIIHRAFIHGLIIKIFTGKSKLLKFYMALDLFIMFSAGVTIVLNNYSDLNMDMIFLWKIFSSLLDTPILLLFFLPAYYVSKMEDHLKKAE